MIVFFVCVYINFCPGEGRSGTLDESESCDHSLLICDNLFFSLVNINMYTRSRLTA